jgi:hypothetical protein
VGRSKRYKLQIGLARVITSKIAGHQPTASMQGMQADPSLRPD